MWKLIMIAWAVGSYPASDHATGTYVAPQGSRTMAECINDATTMQKYFMQSPEFSLPGSNKKFTDVLLRCGKIPDEMTGWLWHKE